MELLGIEITPTLVFLVIAVLVLTYLYSTWPFSTFKNMGVPGPKPWPFWGNMLQVNPGLYQADVDWVKKYGKVFGNYEARLPVLVVADPEMCKQICVKNFTSFYNRRVLPIKDRPLDSGLGNLFDQRWKTKRNTLTPAFSGSKMRKMSPIINNTADAMVSILNRHSKEGTPIQCKDVFGGYVIDSVASAGFGVDTSTQDNPDHPFVKNAKEAFGIGLTNIPLLIMFFCPALIPLLNWLDIGILPKRVKKYFTDLIEETVSVRKSDDESTKRVDFLQLMLDAHDVYEQYIKEDQAEEDEYGVKLVKDGKSDTHDFHKGLSNIEIIAQSITFFLAGYETTSTLMSFVAYSIATYPEIQEKLCAEIDDVMSEYEEPTYEAISKMPYLDMVICEALRMYPPAVRFERVCTADVTIKGINIPKGMVVSMSPYAIHHDPEIYPDPEKFIPERFTKEEKEKRHPYAWLPFGAGPRNCIGMRFALMEAKIGLVRALQDFTFEPCAETEIPLTLGRFGFLSPPKGIQLGVKRR